MIVNRLVLFSVFLLSTILALVPPLHAAVIRNVAISGISSEYVSGADTRRGTNLVAGNDLIGDAHMISAPRSMWLTSPTTAGAVTNAFITFDLGAVRTLSAIKVWNYNEGPSGPNILTRRGIQTADISFAGSDLVFTTNLPAYTFLRAPGVFSDFSQRINLPAISARYVRFNVLSNFGEGDNRVGLSEVQFIDDTVPPLLLSATRNFSHNRVTLSFSEPMLASDATNASNYSISGASILAATLDSFSNVVYLQTSTLVSNQVYTVTAQNVRDASGVISITNTTLTIEPELALWLKADAGVTSDGSGFVSQWNDQSGNNNHALQPNSVLKPSLVPGVLNGNPVLRFNGSTTSTNCLDVPHASTLAVRRDLTIYGVVRAQDFTTINGIVGKTAGNQPGPFDLYLLNNSGQPRLFRGNGSSASSLFGTQNLTAGSDPTNFYIVSVVISGTNGTFFLNGAANGVASLTAGIGDASKPLRIGSRDDFATRLKGDLAELVLVRGALSNSERQAMDSYLGAKYGIPVVSLNITQQPTNTTVLEGQTATFHVNVTANSPSVAYQWQKNGVDIAAATNAVYTTPPVTISDDNSAYRVLVSIPGASQLSDQAFLTVIPDQTAPSVLSVGKKFWAPSSIVAVFSERLDAATAGSAANYTIDNGISVVSATVRNDLRSVVLTTSPVLSAGQGYSVTIRNVKDQFNNTMTETTLPIGTHPMVPGLFLKADAGVTADGSGFVAQWDDQSGNGNHVAQPNGVEFQPILLTNAFNGWPAINFDGTSQYLYCLSSPSLAIIGDMSIYAVARFVDFTNFNEIVGKTSNNRAAPYDFYLNAGNGRPNFHRGDGSASSSVTAVAAPSSNVTHLVAVTMQGASVTHYLDGATNGTGTLNTTIGDNGDAMGIGTRSDLFTKMKGDFAEILILPGVMADIDRMEFETYLNAKYAFMSVPVPPTISFSRSGSNVTLSWSTTPGFILESASELPGTPWSPVTTGISDSGGISSISINVSGGRKFYRLRK